MATVTQMVYLRRRLLLARMETQIALNKALSYSYELQKPAQIKFYEAHLLWLNAELENYGQHNVPRAKADLSNWDKVRVITLRA